MHWQSIDTAPKDGTWVECYRAAPERGTAQRIVVAKFHHFDEGDEAWVWPTEIYDVMSEDGREDAMAMIEDGRCYEDTKFTHWRPHVAPAT